MSDPDLPYGKLSAVWGSIVVFTSFPLSFIVISMMAKSGSFKNGFYDLFVLYLISQILNRIPIGYRWINNFQYNLERLLFLVSFSASVYLVLNPWGISEILSRAILAMSMLGVLLGFTFVLAERRDEFSLPNRLVGGVAGLICILPMPIFIYLNQRPL